jgi:hypothetical protein
LEKQARKDFKYIGRSSYNSRQIRSLIIPHYTQTCRDNANSRSSQIIIGQISIISKSKDIIRFLIGQFDLIMGQIKLLVMFKN